jgi:hypothetical protein
MALCAECGHKNMMGAYFCENCGVRLQRKDETLYRADFEQSDSQLLALKRGSDAFTDDKSLLIYVAGVPNPMVFRKVERLTLGRIGWGNKPRPDVDLTPYEAHQKGVSRIHAALERADNRLLLYDLNSKNGVYLNGLRIQPQRPYTLRDGDEVRLYQLVMHVYFD